MSRRKILPRREVARYDSVDFASKQDIVFNDQKTMNFVSGVIMDMPSGLPRNYVVDNRNAYRGVETLSDLFAYPGGNSSYDLLMTELSGVFVTGTLKPGRYEGVSGIDPFYSSSSDAFKEVNQYEQGNFLDPFYATGSVASIGEPGSFSTGLMNKTQIRMSFPVKNKVQMLPNTSSLYYFNITNGEWNIPSNAIGDHVGPFDKLCFNTFEPLGEANTTIGSIFFEDKIGFNSYGNSIISGSLNIRRQKNGNDLGFCQSSDSFGINFNKDEAVENLTKDYPKSIQRNSQYNATFDEYFTIPIDQPFLIEKIVIEVPFCFGSGWFYDKTITLPITASETDYTVTGSTTLGWKNPFFDSGGPGITLSLMSQINYGASNIRDMITYGLVTHEDDMSSEINIINAGSSPIIPGIGAYATINGIGSIKKANSVISASYKNNERFYTGSVKFQLESFISNGITAINAHYDSGYDPINVNFQINSFENFLKTEFIASTFSGSWTPQNNIGNSFVMDVDAFGRGMTGFSPSGGSIFGGEHVTSQGVIRSDNTIKNPFYVSDDIKRTAAVSAATPFLSVQNSGLYFLAPFNYGSQKQSPYLIMPGQKIILAVSKTRPAHKDFKANLSDNAIELTKGVGYLVSSSFYNPSPNPLGHDVQFNTGSINISFYGSYVKSNREFMT